jgi:hypothetical protein
MEQRLMQAGGENPTASAARSVRRRSHRNSQSQTRLKARWAGMAKRLIAENST